ncbi:MAG: phosphate ABC transporter permease subunit PstC [Treponema sp.]|nr:phosphate ABC transporter permease subunit PstC [Treponema sp.]
MKERVWQAVFLLAACICILWVVLICLFLFVQGVPAVVRVGLPSFLGGIRWKPGAGLYGIAPMILGSLYAAAGALALGVPGGLLSAVFMARFCGKGLYRILSPGVSLLAGIPSVIYGFFGLTAVVPLIRVLFGGSGKSLLAVSLILGIMILPTIITVSEAAIRAVPETCYEGALALGAAHEYAVFFVLVPAAKQGITAGIVLGIGRAVGETMAVIMVAGNQALIPGSPLRGLRTLTANIALEMGYASGLHREVLIATAAALFVFILGINGLLSLSRNRGNP